MEAAGRDAQLGLELLVAADGVLHREDGLGLPEGQGGGEAEDLREFRVCRPDDARDGEDGLVLALEADGPGHLAEHLGPLECVGAAQGVDLALGLVGGEGFDDHAGDVLDMDRRDLRGGEPGPGGEALGLFDAAEVWHGEIWGVAPEDPAADHLDELALGAVDEGGADDGPCEAGFLHELLGVELGLLVFRRRVGSDAQGGDLHVAVDAGVAGGVEDHARRVDVEALEGDVLRELAPDADGVDDGLRPVHEAREGRFVEDVTHDEVDGFLREDVHRLGAVADERPDGDPAGDELADDVPSDETAGAGDGDRHGCCAHVALRKGWEDWCVPGWLISVRSMRYPLQRGITRGKESDCG